MRKHLILNALCILAVLAACTKPEPEPTPTPPEPQPEEVTSLEKPVVTATASGNTISVSWAEVKDAKSYKTEYHKAGEADFKAAGSGAERSCTIGSLEYSTEYVVRVQAIAGKVTSEWSDEVSVTTGELSISYPLTINDATLLLVWLNEYAPQCTEADMVKLGSDIDLSGKELVPAASFAGTFDGGGKSIRNWSATTPLFTEVSGTVKNLIIDSSCSLNGADQGDIALIAGHLLPGGQISGCTNKAPINRVDSFAGTARLGAIVGFLEGNISNCTNEGAITLKNVATANEQVIGGVAGYMAGEAAPGQDRIVKCHNKAPISLTYDETPGKTFLGGVLGASKVTAFADGAPANMGKMKECTNEGAVFFSIGVCATGTYGNVGGVAGYFEGDMEGCINSGDVSYIVPLTNPEEACTRPSVGGVTGYVAFNLIDCSNSGTVTLKGSFANAGGLQRGAGADVGVLCGGVAGGASAKDYTEETMVSGCRNTGKIDVDIIQPAGNSTGADLGGIAGFCNMPVKDCTNIDGDMPSVISFKSTARWTRAGGIVGYQNAGNVTGCSNGKEIVLDANCTVQNVNCSQQLMLGGVIGHHHTHLYTIGNCINNGNLTYKNGWHNQKGATYLGGILGGRNGNSGHTMDGCKNFGKITSQSTSYMMIGGLCGDLFGELKNSSNEGEIMVTNAKADGVYISEIGGLLGYSVCNLEGNTSKGPITVNSSDAVRIGGFCGATQYAKVWSGDTLSAVISSDGACIAGAFLGAIRKNSITLGTPDKPEKVTADARVLGAKVSAENLIGAPGDLVVANVNID